MGSAITNACFRSPELDDEQLVNWINREINAINLVLQRTNIPTPKIHAVEATRNNKIKALFMLLDCLDGNAGTDLGMEIPAAHKLSFLEGLARLHVCILP